jgi:hypothetical protein
VNAPFAWSLADSEVGAITVAGDEVVVAFAAAAVRRDGDDGFVRALRLHLHDASNVAGTDGLGRVREGRLWADGTGLVAPRVPFEPAGPARIELVFHNGVVFRAEAASVAMRFDGDPGFVLSYAC